MKNAIYVRHLLKQPKFDIVAYDTTNLYALAAAASTLGF